MVDPKTGIFYQIWLLKSMGFASGYGVWLIVDLYGGQDWTALCLVLAEQRHVEAIKLPYGEDVLDNFYLHENVDRFFDIFGSRGG